MLSAIAEVTFIAAAACCAVAWAVDAASMREQGLRKARRLLVQMDRLDLIMPRDMELAEARRTLEQVRAML